MNKKISQYFLPAFIGVFTALFLECALEFLTITLSPFGGFGRFPRFIPFCFICGAVGFIIAVFLTYRLYLIIRENRGIKAYFILFAVSLEFLFFLCVFLVIFSKFFAFLQMKF